MKKSKILAALLALVLCLTMPAETVMATTVQPVETQDEIAELNGTEPTGDLKERIWISLDEELLQEAEENTQVEEEDATGASSEWDAYSSDYLYNKMSSAEKSLYNKLDKVCSSALTSKTSYYVANTAYGKVGVMPSVSFSGLSESAARQAVYLFIYDNPQYYFLSLVTAVGNGQVTMCMNSSFANGSSRASATSKVKSKLASWNKAIASKSGVMAKEKMAHDLVTVQTQYKANAYDQTVYSVLVKGQSVCAGYAQTFQMLCNKAGIPTTVVTSDSHEWNKIKINGNWYVVDCTWDDLDGYEVYGVKYAAYYPFMNRSSNVVKSAEMDQKSAHVEESFWPSYTPSCTKDAPVNYSPIKNSSVSQSISASNITKTYKKNATFSIKAKLKKGSGSLSYASSNKKVVTVNSKGTATIKGYGKATISIAAGATTKYQKTTKKITVTIRPAKQTISKVSAKGGSKVAVTYKKDSLASGYQVQYSKSTKFSVAKTVTIGSKSTYSRMLTGLTKGKKYYVRVRSYKTSSGSKVYGEWSTVKSVKVK